MISKTAETTLDKTLLVFITRQDVPGTEFNAFVNKSRPPKTKAALVSARAQ
jgi:hypothetical protein